MSRIIRSVFNLKHVKTKKHFINMNGRFLVLSFLK